MYKVEESDEAAINESFTYHQPQENQTDRYVEIRRDARALAILILESVPKGRARALAITKLEEVVMWANKGIALEVPLPKSDPEAS